jgi:hypothetical protein
MPLTKITGGEFDSTQGGLSVAGIITATGGFIGTVTGNVTGAVSGNVTGSVTAGSISINAANNTISGVTTAGITTAYIGAINDGPISGARNRIINGGTDIWQRGTSTTTTGNTYLADRWVSAISTGGTVSQETSSLPTGSRYAWKFVASASNAFMQMGQQIEYVNCLDLQNTTVSISFMARAVTANAGSTALIVRTRTIAGIDGACIFSAAAVDTSVTLTTSWVRYIVSRTLPATFGALSLEFVLGSHVSGDGIMLSQVQLEPGTVATPFERRSFGAELALCQRYYQRVDWVSTSLGGDGTYQNIGSLVVSMRVQPTLVSTWGDYTVVGNNGFRQTNNLTFSGTIITATAEL